MARTADITVLVRKISETEDFIERSVNRLAEKRVELEELRDQYTTAKANLDPEKFKESLQKSRDKAKAKALALEAQLAAIEASV